MSTEELYERLKGIVDSYKLAVKNSFEQETKNGKKLFRSIANVCDELEASLQICDELFDDDYYFGEENDELPDNIPEQKEQETDEVKKPYLSMDDVLGDDDDTVW